MFFETGQIASGESLRSDDESTVYPIWVSLLMNAYYITVLCICSCYGVSKKSYFVISKMILQHSNNLQNIILMFCVKQDNCFVWLQFNLKCVSVRTHIQTIWPNIIHGVDFLRCTVYIMMFNFIDQWSDHADLIIDSLSGAD